MANNNFAKRVEKVMKWEGKPVSEIRVPKSDLPTTNEKRTSPNYWEPLSNLIIFFSNKAVFSSRKMELWNKFKKLWNKYYGSIFKKSRWKEREDFFQKVGHKFSDTLSSLKPINTNGICIDDKIRCLVPSIDVNPKQKRLLSLQKRVKFKPWITIRVK